MELRLEAVKRGRVKSVSAQTAMMAMDIFTPRTMRVRMARQKVTQALTIDANRVGDMKEELLQELRACKTMSDFQAFFVEHCAVFSDMSQLQIRCAIQDKGSWIQVAFAGKTMQRLQAMRSRRAAKEAEEEEEAATVTIPGVKRKSAAELKEQQAREAQDREKRELLRKRLAQQNLEEKRRAQAQAKAEQIKTNGPPLTRAELHRRVWRERFSSSRGGSEGGTLCATPPNRLPTRAPASGSQSERCASKTQRDELLRPLCSSRDANVPRCGPAQHPRPQRRSRVPHCSPRHTITARMSPDSHTGVLLGKANHANPSAFLDDNKIQAAMSSSATACNQTRQTSTVTPDFWPENAAQRKATSLLNIAALDYEDMTTSLATQEPRRGWIPADPQPPTVRRSGHRPASRVRPKSQHNSIRASIHTAKRPVTEPAGPTSTRSSAVAPKSPSQLNQFDQAQRGDMPTGAYTPSVRVAAGTHRYTPTLDISEKLVGHEPRQPDSQQVDHVETRPTADPRGAAIASDAQQATQHSRNDPGQSNRGPMSTPSDTTQPIRNVDAAKHKSAVDSAERVVIVSRCRGPLGYREVTHGPAPLPPPLPIPSSVKRVLSRPATVPNPGLNRRIGRVADSSRYMSWKQQSVRYTERFGQSTMNALSHESSKAESAVTDVVMSVRPSTEQGKRPWTGQGSPRASTSAPSYAESMRARRIVVMSPGRSSRTAVSQVPPQSSKADSALSWFQR